MIQEVDDFVKSSPEAPKALISKKGTGTTESEVMSYSGNH